MNKITKNSVIAAIVGVTACFIYSATGIEAPFASARDVNTRAVTAAEPTQTVVGVDDRGQLEALPTPLTAADYGPTQESFQGPVFVADAGAPSRIRLGQSITANREASKPLTRQQVAEAKMSGPVAELARAGGTGLTSLIVSYDEHPELFEDGRIESLGGEVIRHYEVLERLAVRLPADSLIELAIDEKVDRVSLDAPIVVTSNSSRRASKAPVAPSSNASFKGKDIGIAVLDSGVSDHSDIAADVRQYSFLNGAYPAPVIENGQVIELRNDARSDGYGHGTHVSGIIAGSGKGSNGRYKGPAAGAKVISLKVLDGNGQGNMSDVMAALDWLLQYGAYFNVRVANLSLGMPIMESNTTDPLVLAVEQLWDSGIVVLVAAGNYGREGYFSITSPGNSRKVITVGSLTDNNTGDDYSDDYVSSYSSRGPTAGDHVSKPDLVAPGNRLIAASPPGSYLEQLLPGLVVSCTSDVNADACNGNYMVMSGTSMATPLVAAAAALMLEKEPNLSPATVKARLMRSAQKLAESPVVAGAGLLDMEAALNETGNVVGEALSPLLVYDEASGGTYMEDTSALWGDEIWGTGYMWSDGGVSVNGGISTDGNVSANGFIWTDGGVNANGYIWTDGSIWANGYLWTDGGVAAFGYTWTDGGVNANGYVWTDGVGANGYTWTDGVRGLSLYDLDNPTPAMYDDEQPTDDN